VPRALAILSVCIALEGCTVSYHREYHPETRVSYVQNVTYGIPEDTNRCRLGRASECWNECFARSRGEACYLLGVMFETGNGVPQRHESAERLQALAAHLGYQPAEIDTVMAAPYLDLWRHESQGKRPPSVPDRGVVRAGNGVVVVYGSLNGDVYVGK
jgi:TPR repeat protein